MEVFGTGKTGEHAGEILGGRVVGDSEVVKRRPDGAVEEAVELQPGSSSLISTPILPDALESPAVADHPRSSLPWALVAASGLLLAICLYLFFGAYLPAKQRLTKLDAELKEAYAREAQAQTKLAQQEKTYALREQQGTALTSERDALAKRIEELEKELTARGRKR